VLLVEEARGNHSVIRLGGMVAYGQDAVALAEALTRAESERRGAVVLDLTDVRHLDSTGLGVVVGSMRRLHGSGREIRLVSPGPRILLLLQMTKLDAMFPVHASVADALAAERGRPTGGLPLGDRDRHDI
jgi:anti-sigma B factor antagonist